MGLAFLALCVYGFVLFFDRPDIYFAAQNRRNHARAVVIMTS
jgi:hypothetical protein